MGTNAAEPENPFAPFQNASTYRMVDWHYNSSATKSIADLDRLAKDVICAPDFNPADIQNFHAATELKRMDDYLDEPGFAEADGWKEESVKLRLPADGVRNPSEDDAPIFEVPGVWVRDLTRLVVSTCEDRIGLDYHIIPFELKFKASEDAEPEDVVSELYNSRAVNSDYQEVLEKSAQLGCDLEPGILALQFWSDMTTLASFGTAALWPIYLYFANLSKYVRGKPTSFAGHHLAYIPSVSDRNHSVLVYLLRILNQLPAMIQDVYQRIFGKPATGAVLTHLKRELIHAIWDLLIDDRFMDAYNNGIVVKFFDGILRRIFPRFYTYSADYPEKCVCVLSFDVKFLILSTKQNTSGVNSITRKLPMPTLPG